MAPKTYYQLLEIPPTAPADEVRRAFRLQIARYHPDKVQHLGEEFQSMAVDRATELTEAYRVLSHPERRADYDRALTAGAAGGAAVAPPAPSAQDVPPPQSPAAPPPDAGAPSQFRQERASRDAYVRKATVARMREALHALGGYEETEVCGFDLSFTLKARLFVRNKGPRLLARFVGTVDADAVADTWAQVGRLNLPSGEEACVFLMGSAMSSPRELAGAIAGQRRRPCRGVRPILIPMDARNWDAHVPLDAPRVAKDLLARLKTSR